MRPGDQVRELWRTRRVGAQHHLRVCPRMWPIVWRSAAFEVTHAKWLQRSSSDLHCVWTWGWQCWNRTSWLPTNFTTEEKTISNIDPYIHKSKERCSLQIWPYSWSSIERSYDFLQFLQNDDQIAAGLFKLWWTRLQLQLVLTMHAFEANYVQKITQTVKKQRKAHRNQFRWG